MLKNRTLWIIIIVIIIVVLGLWGNKKGWFGGSASGDWQAVFLTNGQVYFGHIAGSPEGQYVTLKDIYYLQVQRALQPKPEDSAETPKIQLVKLGSELHAPKDEMRINRDQILFTEALKGDGKVVQSIEKYIKEGPEKPAETPVETSSPSPTKK